MNTTNIKNKTIVSNSYLSSKGYAIKKESLTTDELTNIKKDLTVKPFAPPNSIQKPKSFPIYRESTKNIYVPRYYGFKKYGIPKQSKIVDGEDINIKFEGSLREYQHDIINTYMREAYHKQGCGLLEIPCGRGKCLAKGTKVLMYDETTKKVEDIKDGDLVMGDDYNPRYVWGTTSGSSIMYKIEQEVCDPINRKYIKAKSYTVNSEHILTLYNTVTKCIEDINIKQIINMMKDMSKQFVFEKYRGVISIKLYGIVKTIYTRLINIKQKPVDEYYGFCIDGNRRFLLEDKTVTHNTVMALNIITQIQKKTLVVVHKEFLLNQWIERIEQFIPDAKVGKIQGKIIDIEGKDIVIGMLQSLSMKDYEKDVFDKFGLTIIDECHHISAEVFCRSLFKIVTPYMLGLSATMKRKDGLTHVFEKFIGDVVYKEERKDDIPVNVRIVEYHHSDPEFSETLYNYRGQTHYALMIRKLCEFNHRTELILLLLKEAIEYSKTLNEDGKPQQIMILAHNKSLLEYLYNAVEHRKIGTVGYYVGGMKEHQLKETESKEIVIATYAMAEEALDIKTLSGLILATPKTDVTQAVGRILRMKHKNPFVIDIVDSHEIFQKQFIKRKRFYKKCDYNMLQIDCDDYIKAHKMKHTEDNNGEEIIRCGDVNVTYNTSFWKTIYKTKKGEKQENTLDKMNIKMDKKGKATKSKNNGKAIEDDTTIFQTKREKKLKGKCLFGKDTMKKMSAIDIIKNNLYS